MKLVVAPPGIVDGAFVYFFPPEKFVNGVSLLFGVQGMRGSEEWVFGQLARGFQDEAAFVVVVVGFRDYPGFPGRKLSTAAKADDPDVWYGVHGW